MKFLDIGIFANINFCEFQKIGNFRWIQICVFNVIAPLWHDTSYFHIIHIFTDNTGITRKYVQQDIYNI